MQRKASGAAARQAFRGFALLGLLILSELQVLETLSLCVNQGRRAGSGPLGTGRPSVPSRRWMDPFIAFNQPPSGGPWAQIVLSHYSGMSRMWIIPRFELRQISNMMSFCRNTKGV